MDEDDPWSVTRRALRERMRAARERGTAAAVATVADVDGSAYRRPGARMLVPVGDDGEAAGAVTAGCLEDEVIDLARTVVETGEPRLRRFDLTSDDDGTWGLGLGCNGVVDVFVEPLDAGWDRPLARLAAGEPVTVVTVVDGPGVGSRSIVDDDPSTAGGVDGRAAVPAALRDDPAVGDAVAATRAGGSARTVAVDGRRLLVDALAPAPRLLLFGAGNDLRPVARLGARVGFEVVVHSPRGAVDGTTVPHADEVVTGRPTTVADAVDDDARTYAVVMSHNLLDDRLALTTLLAETAVPYVGLMGPRERFEEIRAAMADDGDPLPESARERVATPVGLDLGGDEPVQIALSVVGEALAVANGREGGRLRDQSGPIHPRPAGE